MGLVYAAVEDGIGRRVAVRIGQAGDLRVHHQARMTGQVAHPTVVSVLDLGADQGRPFVVMERLDGAGLDGGAAARPLEARLELMALVCDGLQAAHDRGVVHGHVKPSHVFLPASGGVKLLDFGAGLGRPDAYASPEEVQGQPATERSDVFSAAAVFHFMLTGRAPFASRGAAVAEPPPAIPHTQAPDSLSRTLLTALDKDPARRHQSIKHLRAELGQVRRGQQGTRDRVLKAAFDRYLEIQSLLDQRRALGRRLGLPAVERECDDARASLAAAFPEFAGAGAGGDGLGAMAPARASEALAQLQAWHNDVLAAVSVLRAAGGER